MVLLTSTVDRMQNSYLVIGGETPLQVACSEARGT